MEMLDLNDPRLVVEEVIKHAGGKKLRPPLSVKEFAEAEARLGFRLPQLLKELYSLVGDGGFGPNNGFLPLLKPVSEVKLMNLSLAGVESAVELYELFRKGDPEDTSWSWPFGLLPIVDWGCAIRSCADCSAPSVPVLRDEPYVKRAMESPSLEYWLKRWLAGEDLWKSSN